MKKKNVSRRDFIKQNSLAGAGVMIGMGMAPSILSAATGASRRPAAAGGDPVRTAGWPDWPQWIPEEDEELLLETVRSGVWSRANKVSEFEEVWAETVGSERCVTTVNGTNALFCAMANMDIGAGDEVLLSPYTFIACPQTILQNGAMPVFVDVDPQTFQMDPEKIEEKITPRTRAIMAIHIGGYPSDMNRIMEIADRHNLVVVEDACQAWLSEIDGKQVGTIGKAGCYSFQNSKNIPLGEGGAIVSDDHEFIDRCFSFHNFGNPYRSVQGEPGSGTLRRGTKLRMAEYQAAIGLAQIKRFQEQTDKREANADYLYSLLKEIPGITPCEKYDNVTRVSYHLFMFRFNSDEFAGMNKGEFAQAMRSEGIPILTGYNKLNEMPYLEDNFNSKLFQQIYPADMLDFEAYKERNRCPENDRLCDYEALWLLHHVLLGERSDMEDIAEAVQKIHRNADAVRTAIREG